MEYPLLRRHRRGTTLIELLLFVALFVAMAGLLLPLLRTVQKSQARQSDSALFLYTGIYVTEQLERNVRSSFQVVEPAPGGTSTVLAMTTTAANSTPTIIGKQGGVLMLTVGDASVPLTPTSVAVTDFTVENIGTSATPSLVRYSITVERIDPVYEETRTRIYFGVVANAVPRFGDLPYPCGCNPPACTGDDEYRWEKCNEPAPCSVYIDSIECTP